ncbi:MAG: tyrosine-type recombinase/integrase [Planctomycetaceae bacterium]|nr:tyrosine-type recombinase/integrase [Planctomycetaceae bacterium]
MNERIRVTHRVTIYPRGKKQIYTADFWFDRQHRRRSLKTRNLKQAKAEANELDHQIRNGSFVHTATDQGIEATVERFLENKRVEERAPRTLTRYRGELREFTQFCQRRRVNNLSQITPSLVDSYRAERLKTRKLSTVNHETEVLRQLLEWAMSRHLLNQNPMQRMRFSKPKRDPQPALKRAQLIDVLNLATERLQFILAALLMTGCRIGELQHLLHKDVDLAGDLIHIVSRPGAETKTRRSRKIPLHPRLKMFLQQKIKTPGLWYFCAEPSDTYPQGDHEIAPKRINEEFQSLLKRCGIPTGRKANGYTLHSLRHFFETVCVNSQVPQVLVDRWMGHSTKGSMGAVYYDDDDVKAMGFMAGVDFPLLADGKWQ